MTERRSCAPARRFTGVPNEYDPKRLVRRRGDLGDGRGVRPSLHKSLRDFGSAVPAIIADLIITAAKDGERDPARLYEQILNDYGIDNSSKLGRDLPVSAYTSVAQAA